MLSKDKVRFNIPWRIFSRSEIGYRRIVKKSFDLDPRPIDMASGITIVCRPSQFGRFLIYRHEEIRSGEIMGSESFIAEINPILFVPKRSPDEYDVSGNPNRNPELT